MANVFAILPVHMNCFSTLLWLLALVSSSLAMPAVLYDYGLNGTYPETINHVINYAIAGKSTLRTLLRFNATAHILKSLQ